MKPFCLPPGGACLNKAPQMLLKVTLVRESSGAASSTRERERFALCVSLCHVVADGHTFYTLYGMLGTQGKPSALIVDRPPTLIADTARILGGHDCQTWLESAGFLVRAARMLIFAPLPRARFLPATSDWITALHTESSNASNASTVISTNDVLTSWCMIRSGRSEGLMAVNMRGRIPNYTPRHAGNYEFMVVYQKGDFESPSLIRQSLGVPLLSFSRSSREATKPAVATRCAVNSSSETPRVHVRRFHGNMPLPGFFSTAMGSTCLVTNWAGLYQDLALPESLQARHIPLYYVRDAAAVSETRVIFRPRAEDLEVLALTRLSALCLVTGIAACTIPYSFSIVEGRPIHVPDCRSVILLGRNPYYYLQSYSRADSNFKLKSVFQPFTSRPTRSSSINVTWTFTANLNDNLSSKFTSVELERHKLNCTTEVVRWHQRVL